MAARRQRRQGRARTHGNWAKSFRRICIFLGTALPAASASAPTLYRWRRGCRACSAAPSAFARAPRRAFDRISQQRHHGGSERPRVARAARHGDHAGRNGGGVATAPQGDGRELRSNIGEAVGSVRDAAPAREMGRPAGPDDGGYAQQCRRRRRGLVARRMPRGRAPHLLATPTGAATPSRARRKLARGGRTRAERRGSVKRPSRAPRRRLAQRQWSSRAPSPSACTRSRWRARPSERPSRLRQRLPR